MAQYDIEAVRSACANRWPEIFAALSGVSIDIFDGKGHPCPKCGGVDRFRFTDTKKSGKGGALCNQCLTTKNGDGFGVVQWLLDVDFSTALEKIAAYCGIKPKPKSKADPARDLDFLPWNPTIVALWCKAKGGIKPEAIQSVGGRLATYRNEYRVIAIPVIGHMLKHDDIVGWVIYRADGGELPVYEGRSSVVKEWKKLKITYGSEPGVIGSLDGAVVWKVEGPSDLLAHISMGLPDGHSAFTTSSGAKETPKSWILKALTGKTVYVVHDADVPGQEGATYVPCTDGSQRPGWAPSIAKYALECRNVCLPFEVRKTDGQDLRDFYRGGGTFNSLLDQLENSQLFTGQENSGKDEYIDREVNDPMRLARVNLRQYQDQHGGRLIYWRSDFWKWKGGYYRKIEDRELRAKVWSSISKEFERCWLERPANAKDKKAEIVTASLVTNVIGAMESLTIIPSSVPMPCMLSNRTQPHYMAMKNGLLNLDAVFEGKPAEECLLPHTSDWFSPFMLPYEFDPNASCPLWLDYIQYVMDGDWQRINLLQEWLGYLLTSSNYMQKFMAFEGDGQNGKSVFFAVVKAMLGESNISTLSIENFGKDYELSETLGKAVNISGDVGEIDSVCEGTLKQFTGGDTMTFNRKFKSPLTAVPTAKLMVAWNNRPRFKDRSMGLWRRMLLVPFNRAIPADRRVLNMDKDYWWIDQGEVSGILNWAMVGLDRLNSQGAFTHSDLSQDALDDYRTEANPAGEFLRDYLQPSDRSVSTQVVYRVYARWCEKNGYRPLGTRMLGKEVKRIFPNSVRQKIREGKSLEWKYLNLEFSVDEIFGESVESQSKINF